jgi:hypothetical protein
MKVLSFMVDTLRDCLKFEMAHKNQKFTPILKGDF